MRIILVGSRLVGDGKPPVVSAEAGLNWNGDPGLGLDLIRAAAECGCDAVKFQNYRVADFVRSKKETYIYGRPGEEKTETKWEMFRQCELDLETLHAFQAEADRVGLIFHSTPTGEPGVRDLLDAGTPILKNSSDMVNNIFLVRAMIETRLPLLISTSLELGFDHEVAMGVIVRAGGRQWRRRVILLHCVSEYPAAKGKANLRRIEDLRKKWGCLVGYSDHTIGIECAVQAVKQWGACWIEKHFTLDKSLLGPDHWFSADPKEMGELVQAVRSA